MLSLVQFRAFADSLRDRQCLTLYVPGALRADEARDAWMTRVNGLLADWRQRLVNAPHAEREQFARAADHVHERLARAARPGRFPGWVGIATEDGLVFDEITSVAEPIVVQWEHGTPLVPWVRSLITTPPVLVALIDSRHAQVFSSHNSDLHELFTLQVRPEVGPISHMGDPPRERFHAGTRGDTGRDLAEHERVIERQWLQAELVEKISPWRDRFPTILVGGIPTIAAATVRLLREEYGDDAAHQVDGLDVHATPAVIRAKLETTLPQLARESSLQAVADIIDGAPLPEVVCRGHVATLDALAAGAVDLVLLSANWTVEHERTAEALLTSGLAHDADVRILRDAAGERLEREAGGVAAHRRYRLASAPPLANPFGSGMVQAGAETRSSNASMAAGSMGPNDRARSP